MAGESDARQAVREPRVPASESGTRLREEAGVGQGARVLPTRAEDQPQVRSGPARVHAAAGHAELAGDTAWAPRSSAGRTAGSAGPRRRNAQLRWAMRGQDPREQDRP